MKPSCVALFNVLSAIQHMQTALLNVTSGNKKFCMIFIVIASWQQILMAQNEKQFPAFTFRTNPVVGLIENDGNIMLGAGIHLSPRIAFSVDPALVLYHFDMQKTFVNPAWGLKLRADARFFLRKFIPYGPNRYISFIGAEFHYKNISESKVGDFGMNCINRNCEYYQQSDYTLRRRETGVLVKYGGIFPLNHSRRLNMEFFAGLGVRTQTFRYKNIPLDGTTPRELSNETDKFPYIPISDKINGPTLLLLGELKFFYFLAPPN